MKCPKCGKEYKENSLRGNSRNECPFCNSNFEQSEREKEDIRNIIKNIVEQYGVDVLYNTNRTNALLMDLAPRMEKERKLIVMAMKEGIVPQLMKITNETKEYQQIIINRCINQLVESIWITKTAARYAVMVLAGAAGITIVENYDDIAGNETDKCKTQTEESISSDKILTKEDEITSQDAVVYALKNCHTIGYKALAANKDIQQLILPKNITTIYPKAFLNCIHLKKMILPQDIKNIGECAFEGCSQLEKIEIEEGKNFKVINGILIDKVHKKTLRAENDSRKEEIEIVNGIVTIGKKTFDRTPVKCIKIPRTTESIEENAFYRTENLERIEVDSGNLYFSSRNGVLFNKTSSVLVKYPQGKKNIGYYLEDRVEAIGVRAFSCVWNIQSITFNSSLKTIGNRAFEYCTNVENIMLPGNLEVIGERAFQYCEKLRSIMLSRNIREIGDCAFYHCTSLESISVPRMVEIIGNYAFANCKNLKIVTVQEHISFIGDGAVLGCNDIEIRIKNNPYMETYCRVRGMKFVCL